MNVNMPVPFISSWQEIILGVCKVDLLNSLSAVQHLSVVLVKKQVQAQ